MEPPRDRGRFRTSRRQDQGSWPLSPYDNLKRAVLDRVGDAIPFNPELLGLAAHYRFEPRPVAVARGNEFDAMNSGRWPEPRSA